jgi:hypothetical protein
MFINLETDPCIPHSSPHRTCVNLPPPIAFGLPLTSALGRYSDSRSCLRSDTPWTPTHVCTRTLLRLPLTSALGHSLDSHSRLHSDITRTPAHVRARTLLGLLLTSAPGLYSTQNPALVVLSIHISEVLARLTAILYSHIPTSLGAPCLSALRVLRTPLGRSAQVTARTSVSQFILQVRARAFGPRLDLRPRTPFDLRPQNPFGPPSLSALPSEPLSSNSAQRSARTFVSRSASRV